MTRAGVPTPNARAFADLSEALRYIGQQQEPLVVKASGLAAGKGAFGAAPRPTPAKRPPPCCASGIGQAGDEILVVEFVEGEELSVLALTDGEHFAILPPAQDHKQIGDGDTGPNTGGIESILPGRHCD